MKSVDSTSTVVARFVALDGNEVRSVRKTVSTAAVDGNKEDTDFLRIETEDHLEEFVPDIIKVVEKIRKLSPRQSTLNIRKVSSRGRFSATHP